MKTWNVNHFGNDIVVKSEGTSERLYINGKLQDEEAGPPVPRVTLWGQIPSGGCVKVSLGGKKVKAQCKIFIDNTLVLSE